MTTPALGSNLSEPVYDVRRLKGADIRYRVGHVDEFLLDHEYVDLPLFAEGYSLSATDTILDVGAHIGIFTVLAAQRVPQGKVYGIEPDQMNFEMLNTNIELNGLTNAQSRRVAFGSTSGTVRLYHGPESWSPSIHLNETWGEDDPSHDFAAFYEEVPAQTLDQFFAVNGISSVDYLKMNINGAECDVFATASMNALRIIQFMHVEMHPVADEVSNALLDKVREAGFEMDIKISNNPHVRCWLIANL